MDKNKKNSEFKLCSASIIITPFFAIHESPLASVPTSWSSRHRGDFTPLSTRVSLIFAIFCACAGCNWRHCQGKNQEDRQKPFLEINQSYWLSKQSREDVKIVVLTLYIEFLLKTFCIFSKLTFMAFNSD